MNTIMTHIIAGYPSLRESKELAETMIEAGIPYVEIQIPFSDPIADGKTIMEANQRSLINGVTPEDAFNLMESLKEKAKQYRTKLLFMSYFNILHKYGLERFCKKAEQVNCYGLIVPDIPIDEETYEHYLANCKKYNLHAIQIISPITPARRLKEIAKHVSGFVYCVSRTGVTGEREKISLSLKSYLDNVRKYIDLPIALGFGISSRVHVKEALAHADIAVVGSKILNIFNQSKKGTAINKIKQFMINILK